MTYAPADLLVVRRYVLARTGLSGDAVGIVGDPDHVSTGGYHIGNDGLSQTGRLNTDYSKRESSRDRPGTNAASALDIGDFRLADGRTQRDLAAFEVAAARRGDPRAEALREIIWSPDGRSVTRWDRLGIRSTGDDSHRFHGHRSFFRDSEGRRDRPDSYFGLLVEFFEGNAVMGVEEWAASPGDRSWSLTQGPLHPATDEVWVPDGIAGHQRDTALGHAWHAAITAATTAARCEAMLGAIIKRLDAIGSGGGVGLSEQQVEDAAFRGAQRAEDS